MLDSKTITDSKQTVESEPMADSEPTYDEPLPAIERLPESIERLPGSLPMHNRIPQLMAHAGRYSFRGLPQLARDAGISRSALYRLVQEKTYPTLDQAHRITHALSEALGKPLDINEVFSPTDSYPTPSACTLCDCQGCSPEWPYTPKPRPHAKN